MFEHFEKSIPSQEIFKYYHSMFKHELSEYEENFTKWEVNRIY
jgi:hypothetical protein